MKKLKNVRAALPGAEKIPASYVLFGIAAGFLNGAFGALGGLALAFVLGAAKRGNSDGSKDALASSLCVMLPVSIFTLLTSSEYVSAAVDALSLFPAAALGGLCGAFFSDRLKGGSVKYIFAALTGIAGLNMLFGR
ncbi:MAG: TSUP family transporter [Clostridia bacterium]|nr:TSUP family transporter [Clostridia bacterium]